MTTRKIAMVKDWHHPEIDTFTPIEITIIKHNPVSGLVRSGALKRAARKARPMEFAKLPKFWRWLHNDEFSVRRVLR